MNARPCNDRAFSLGASDFRNPFDMPCFILRGHVCIATRLPLLSPRAYLVSSLPRIPLSFHPFPTFIENPCSHPLNGPRHLSPFRLARRKRKTVDKEPTSIPEFPPLPKPSPTLNKPSKSSEATSTPLRVALALALCSHICALLGTKAVHEVTRSLSRSPFLLFPPDRAQPQEIRSRTSQVSTYLQTRV